MSTPAPRRPAWYRLRVSRVEPVADDTVAVTLAVPARLTAAFTAVPGQHVTVRHRPTAATEVRRPYSVCPPPAAPDTLRLVVRRRSPDGFGAHALTALAAGDELDVSPPAGRFTVPTGPAGHQVLIAGGTGITPLAAMAQAALRGRTDCRVSLVHAVRTSATALLSDELAALKDAFTDRFTVLYVLSRERHQSDLLTGRIDAHRLRRLLTVLGARPEDTVFALCGPLGLLETARTALAAWGAPPDRVRWETFSSDGTPPDTPAPHRAGPIKIVLDGRTTTVTMRPGDAVILDALLRERAQAPYACRDGVCGSCRAKVVTGGVTTGHQHALDADEVAAGYTLACRARPSTPDLTLDFDT
ncbi:2Fe-2S iron-sulfur cluster-binding protein [Streptomyces sp. NPDC051014]|uniref:2Fe-2S iron-sulfur cluster-binding protein n=1 Tax=Streptomyces sp. NPDC051014 TaxID=3155751 RepID=UPI0033D6D19C